MYVGNNSSTGSYAYFDDLSSSLFEDLVDYAPVYIFDDFNSYEEGMKIEDANKGYIVFGTDAVDVEAKVGHISEGNNVLYLFDNSEEEKPSVSRYFSETEARSGTVSFRVLAPESMAYITLGNKTEDRDQGRFTKFRIGNGSVLFENERGEHVPLALYQPDSWVNVSISWEPSTVIPEQYKITATIDGFSYDSYFDENNNLVPMLAQDFTAGPQLVLMYVGSYALADNQYAWFDELNIEIGAVSN